MIIKLKEIQNICNTIVGAVDSNELSIITETLALWSDSNAFYMAVTNKEYYVQTNFPYSGGEDFKATVNAILFLKLISQLTTEDVELTVTDSYLNVVGNGSYKLPLIYGGDSLLELPKIEIENVSHDFIIPTDILLSILNYNSKELLKGSFSKPVQKLYYVDEKGAITFTSGACINNFSLPQPIKILLNNRLVKLFKLFKSDKVHFIAGHSLGTDTSVKTRVRFSTPEVEISAILPGDDTLISTVPVTAIRTKASSVYPYSINLNKDALLQSLNRLSLFQKDFVKPYDIFEFYSDKVEIFDINKNNKEVLSYNNNLPEGTYYKTFLDYVDLKLTLETCTEPYITLSFGDQTAIVIQRGNVTNVIVECKE